MGREEAKKMKGGGVISRHLAEQDLLAAVWLKPDYVKAYYCLGKVYRELGDNQKALQNAKEAKKLEPTNQLVLDLIRDIETGVDFFMANTALDKISPSVIAGSRYIADRDIDFVLNLKYDGARIVSQSVAQSGVAEYLDAVNQNIDLDFELKNDLQRQSVFEIEVRVSKENCNPRGAAQFFSFENNKLIIYLSSYAFKKSQVGALGIWVEIYRAIKGEFEDRLNADSSMDSTVLNKIYKRYAVVMQLINRDKLVEEMFELERQGILRTEISLADIFRNLPLRTIEEGVQYLETHKHSIVILNAA